MFPDRTALADREIFKGQHYTPEPPPTPAEMFRALGLALAAVLYIVLVICLFASILDGPIPR
jgi:hypothetical protein